MNLYPFIFILCFCQTLSAATFVFGDAFPSDGTGDFNSPATGNNSDPANVANAGNEVTTVYEVDTGDPGNPFNDGNPGGTFNPIVAGNISGTDYRSTTTFDLSDIAPAPAGSAYSITSIELFFEISSNADQMNQDVNVNLFAALGVTSGPITQSPDGMIFVGATQAPGSFVSGTLLNSSVDLNSPGASLTVTLDVPQDGVGVRFGSDLSTAANPNTGINGTNFVQVAPRLVIEVDIVPIPEPSNSLTCMLGLLALLSYRNRR